jgi:hypothetical protein
MTSDGEKLGKGGEKRQMKKTVAVIAAVALLSIAAVASAHMWGWGGGPGYGPHMRGWGGGPGYGTHMYGWGPGYGLSDEDRTLLEETSDLRRQRHAKVFDLREALRTGDSEKAEAIEKEVTELDKQLRDKLGPRFGRGYGKGPYAGGYGRGGGWRCPGPSGW